MYAVIANNYQLKQQQQLCTNKHEQVSVASYVHISNIVLATITWFQFQII